jgi:hypothetical protein
VVTPSEERLRRLRLAAQRLTPHTAARDVREAARAVVGVQAQDVRAAGLALRSRVPGLRRSAVDDSGLVRTWTVRGTVHLIDPDDRAWLHAVVGHRHLQRVTRQLTERGGLEIATAVRDDLVALLAETPLHRAALLRALEQRGHRLPPQPVINTLMPWAAAQGLVLGLPDGRYRAAQPPPAVDADLALATLGRRYLLGYGPATVADLASWSGLPRTAAQRAFAALDGLDTAGELVALPGMLDAEDEPEALLLAAFDTTMLGHRSRAPFVAPAHDRRVLPGGGMLRPVVLVHGVAAGTWGAPGAGPRRSIAIDWFDTPVESAALHAEMRDVERFLRG